MSKKLKTWEMIKELTENPEKRFKGLSANKNDVFAYTKESLSFGIGIFVKWHGLEEELLELKTGNNNKGPLHIEWEEVIEPVDFLTAYKDCLENGTKYRGVSIDGDECDEQTMEKRNGEGVHIMLDQHDTLVYLNCQWIKQ